MPSRHAVGHRDANEPDIVAVLKAANVRFVYGHEGDGYDLLVMTSPMQLWEVKNPAQKPSARKLTEAEKDCMAYCQYRGIPYKVIETPEQAANEL